MDNLSESDLELIKRNTQIVIDHCLNITLRLVRLSKDQKKIIGIASGFIYNHGNDFYIISAGHALKKERWVIETNVSFKDDKVTVCIPINYVWQIDSIKLGNLKPDTIDFAWAKLDFDKFKSFVAQDSKLKGNNFEFNSYLGPLDEEPQIGEAYSYASWNRVTLIKASCDFLERESSYEIGMEYQGRIENSKFYKFKLSRVHQGHDYYRGASGSPILDPTGKIVSILLGPVEGEDALYGLALKDFHQCILLGQ